MHVDAQAQSSAAAATAVVELNDVPLFRVVGENRALLVDGALQQLVATDQNGVPTYDASTLRVWAHHDAHRIWIVATDARHPTPVTIVTVTSADAKAQQSTPDAVAASWQSSLQTALVQALLKLEPAVEKRHMVEVAGLGAALTAWTAVLFLLLNASQRRSRALATTLEAEDAADYDAALRRSRVVHRLRVLSSASGVLFWLTVLAWFAAAAWSLAQFTPTTALSRDLSHGAGTIVVIWIGAAVVNRLCDLAITRMATNWQIRHYTSSEERARVLLRAPTATSAIGHFKTFALAVIAGFLTLGQLGLPVSSILTIGGVTALAVTLSAQNFLKDVIGGIAVLYEDQYAIGDLVTINGHTGIVENVTLRIVMIRDTNGSAVAISHSAVSAVANFSRNWSRIDYQLSISPEGDPDRAIDVIRATIEQLAQDGSVGRGLLMPIEWIGVHAFTQTWTLIRASIRTAPLQQSRLRREINRIVRRRLAEAGIPYGPPIEPQFVTPL